MKDKNSELFTFEEYLDDLDHLCAECGCVYVYEENERLCPYCRYMIYEKHSKQKSPNT